MAVFVPKCSQKHGKDRKLKDFCISSICEEGESPHTLQWLEPSEPEFYGEYNGSKYNLVALVLL